MDGRDQGEVFVRYAHWTTQSHAVVLGTAQDTHASNQNTLGENSERKQTKPKLTFYRENSVALLLALDRRKA